MESQNKAILEHLTTGKTINSLEALNLFWCFRLAARISNLRQDHNIESIPKEYANSKGKKVRTVEYKYISKK